MNTNVDKATALRAIARSIRLKFLRMHFHAKAGHIGTGLSCIDLLTYLYAEWLSADGRLVLSKGHGASSLYATLHEFGHISDAELATYYKDDSLFPAHPAARTHDAIVAATGSLGHGLPIAAGIAFAEQTFNGATRKTVALLSDGECNEGATWEAALFAGHHKLEKLTVVVDANGLQGFGRTVDVLDLEPFADKWRAFGFDVAETNGHDFNAIATAFAHPRRGKPLCVLARTQKGRGVRLMEDKLEWHYLPMTEEQFMQAVADIERGTELDL